MKEKLKKMAKKIYNALRKMKVYYHNYGIRGVMKAVWNRINNRPGWYGLKANDYYAMEDAQNCYVIRGNEILQRQQNEYSGEEYIKKIEELRTQPLISIICPLYNPIVKWLEVAIQSLTNQYYTNWELLAIDDGSKDKRGIDLVKRYMKKDNRIRLIENYKNKGISTTSNVGLQECNGEYIALLDQDDELTRDALFWVAYEINRDPQIDMLYSDECKVKEGKNEFFDFMFKPDWSPVFLLNSMYTGHLSVYRTQIVRQIGGFRKEFDFSQDYDLALRITQNTTKIVHIERILYFWRAISTSGAAGGKNFARRTNIMATSDWYRRNGISSKSTQYAYGNIQRIQGTSRKKVSIIIPTDSEANLRKCIIDLINKTSYFDYEIIPVTNSKTAALIGEEFNHIDYLRICHFDEVYNFSRKCNVGADFATGDVLVFYNDDVSPKTHDWVERMLDLLELPGVGGVSPTMLYENGSIQYSGMILGTPCMIGTSFNGRMFSDDTNLFCNWHQERNVSILCGACMMMQKELFNKVGRFDEENTPIGHSDLDLSLKIIENGYYCAVTPIAKLIHIGNHSWEKKEKKDKADIYCLKRWGKYLQRDPFFTNSMKEYDYHDFNYAYQIYSPENQIFRCSGWKKDLLFVSHELTLTGAPIILFETIKQCVALGHFVVVTSPVDGPLRQKLLECGVTVIIDEAVINGHWTFERFARNFDLVIVNTLACGNAISQLNNSLPQVIWWIHEGTMALDALKSCIPTKINNNKIHVYAISEYTERILRNAGYAWTIMRLQWGIEDSIMVKRKEQHDEFRILCAGSIERRKGQDILIEAIKHISTEFENRIKVYFAGNELERMESVASIRENDSRFEFLGIMNHDELLNIMNNCDVVVVPSRDEPMSIVAVEAFMLRVPVIVSSNTGISSFICNGTDGFIFVNENWSELKQWLEQMISDKDMCISIGDAGRNIYNEHFTLPQFQKQFGEIVEKYID